MRSKSFESKQNTTASFSSSSGSLFGRIELESSSGLHCKNGDFYRVGVAEIRVCFLFSVVDCFFLAKTSLRRCIGQLIAELCSSAAGKSAGRIGGGNQLRVSCQNMRKAAGQQSKFDVFFGLKVLMFFMCIFERMCEQFF